MGKFINYLWSSIVIAHVCIGAFYASLLGVTLLALAADVMTKFAGTGVLCLTGFGIYGLFKYVRS